MDPSKVDLSEDRSGEIIAIAWVFTGLGIAVVSLKLFARAHITKLLGWDDFFIFFSMALSIVAAALVHYSVTLGLGKHTALILQEHGPERLVQTAKWQILGYPFNIGAFSFPNISIAILINKLLNHNRWRTMGLYAMVILQVVIAMISVFIVFFMCNPTEKLWNRKLEGTCMSPYVLNDFSYFLSAWTTLTDIILAAVPISAFWKLQMKMATKIGLCIMMSLTLLSAIVTIIKAKYLHLFTINTDPLYDVIVLVNWGLVEQNVVIVAACIPTLRPFFYRAFKGERLTDEDSRRAPQQGSRSLGGKSILSRSKKSQMSVSEVPLDDIEGQQGDGESHTSQQRIWRTTKVSMEWQDRSKASRETLS